MLTDWKMKGGTLQLGKFVRFGIEGSAPESGSVHPVSGDPLRGPSSRKRNRGRGRR